VWNLPSTILARITKLEEAQKKAQTSERDKRQEEEKRKKACDALWKVCRDTNDNNSRECAAYRDCE
jgi:hypothetical protein